MHLAERTLPEMITHPLNDDKKSAEHEELQEQALKKSACCLESSLMGQAQVTRPISNINDAGERRC